MGGLACIYWGNYILIVAVVGQFVGGAKLFKHNGASLYVGTFLIWRNRVDLYRHRGFRAAR